MDPGVLIVLEVDVFIGYLKLKYGLTVEYPKTLNPPKSVDPSWLTSVFFSINTPEY